MKTGIVIQGPTRFYKEMCKEYHGQKNIVWSTWDNQSPSSLEYIENSEFSIDLIKNPEPHNKGPRNINLQVLSTLHGLKYLKNVYNCNHALKIRSDLVLPHGFLEGLDLSEPTFLCWHNRGGGYLVDYFFGGPMDLMLELCDFEVKFNEGIPPEAYIVKKLKEMGISKVNCVLPQLTWGRWLKNGVDIAKALREDSFEIRNYI